MKHKSSLHVCIIPDGNARWAKNRHLPILAGHTKGLSVMEAIVPHILAHPSVKTLTLWGFSADNWKRPQEEVNALMGIFEKGIKRFLDRLLKENIRVVHLGRKDRIPPSLSAMIAYVEETTRDIMGKTLCIAIDFGGEDQMLRIAEKARELKGPITSQSLRTLYDGAGSVGPADILIRTAGQMRTSDVGWLNGAQTELFFLEPLFPDITSEDIDNVISVFMTRERRLGGRPHSSK